MIDRGRLIVIDRRRLRRGRAGFLARDERRRGRERSRLRRRAQDRRDLGFGPRRDPARDDARPQLRVHRAEPIADERGRNDLTLLRLLEPGVEDARHPAEPESRHASRDDIGTARQHAERFAFARVDLRSPQELHERVSDLGRLRRDRQRPHPILAEREARVRAKRVTVGTERERRAVR
jgi:hypothetical protein